ncbi:MAG: proprotein convertase P-domain-containing protein [Proteobacteria bacterium]|nr:proprotein convertase P-domain-containing protein [Pseudomonadota bacterium]
MIASSSFRLALAACLLSSVRIARADVLQATLDQPMFEVSHTVDVRIEDGVATYKVKRQFANPGKVADEAHLEIDLPTGAAATGLRIRAKDRWYDGELMERDKAAKLYQELTGFGAAQPKDPALLAWMWADKLSLQVFPVMPGQVSTVEYTLTVPTRYAGGRYWMSYPRTAADGSAGLALATPIISVHPAWGNAMTAITVDGKRAAPDTAVVLTPPIRQPWQDAVGADASASYVASAIEIPASSHTAKPVTTATLTLELHHTYKSDLRIELLAPSGQHVVVFDRKGGGDNNVIGTFPVMFPAPTPQSGTWRLVVSDHAGLDNGSIDKWSLQLGETTATATDTPVFIPDAPETSNDAGLAAIAVEPPPIATWTARLGKVVASDLHAFGRLEVDTAPQLVPLPKHASLVFVIDASFSVTLAMIDAQLAIVKTYVAHVPDAQVAIVVYRRAATALWSGFLSASPAILSPNVDDARRAGKLALGNGSSLDAGLALAAQTLAKRTGPRRIIVMTDRRLRTTLTAPAVAATLDKLPADIVVHAIAPQLDNDDRVQLTRDDKDPLAPVATRHHGIFVELAGMPDVKERLAPTEKARPPDADREARRRRRLHARRAGAARGRGPPPVRQGEDRPRARDAGRRDVERSGAQGRLRRRRVLALDRRVRVRRGRVSRPVRRRAAQGRVHGARGLAGDLVRRLRARHAPVEDRPHRARQRQRGGLWHGLGPRRPGRRPPDPARSARADRPQGLRRRDAARRRLARPARDRDHARRDRRRGGHAGRRAARDLPARDRLARPARCALRSRARGVRRRSRPVS